jgi:hypothetical protein
MMLFLGWLFFCAAAAMFAVQRRNRNGVGWFFVAFFFSPLVAFVLLAILREIDPNDPSDPLNATPLPPLDFDKLPAREQRRLMKLRIEMLQRRQ